MSHRHPAMPDTIVIGYHKAYQHWSKALERAGHKVGVRGRELLKQTPYADSRQELRLTQATTAELGFPSGTSFAQIKSAILARGGKECPAEAGPALREQYIEQPMDEPLHVFMSPLRCTGGSTRIFLVGRNSAGRWLRAVHMEPDDHCDADDIWVFLRD